MNQENKSYYTGWAALVYKHDTRYVTNQKNSEQFKTYTNKGKQNRNPVFRDVEKFKIFNCSIHFIHSVSNYA